jgi:phenylalanyl-tRNA synthetase beta chain
VEVAESNARYRDRLALYEIGPVYLASEGDPLPEEPLRSEDSTALMDFFDMKGVLGALFEHLHLDGYRFENSTHPSFHPGKCAHIMLSDTQIGVMGELHPLVKERYDLRPRDHG